LLPLLLLLLLPLPPPPLRLGSFTSRAVAHGRGIVVRDATEKRF
jgi:hypothetical protein